MSASHTATYLDILRKGMNEAQTSDKSNAISRIDNSTMCGRRSRTSPGLDSGDTSQPCAGDEVARHQGWTPETRVEGVRRSPTNTVIFIEWKNMPKYRIFQIVYFVDLYDPSHEHHNNSFSMKTYVRDEIPQSAFKKGTSLIYEELEKNEHCYLTNDKVGVFSIVEIHPPLTIDYINFRFDKSTCDMSTTPGFCTIDWIEYEKNVHFDIILVDIIDEWINN